MKFIALFADKAEQATVARELEARGAALLPMQSIAGVLQALRGRQGHAVLLQDHAGVVDWLHALQTHVAGGVPVVVVGGAGGVGMAEALAHGATDYADREASADRLLARVRAHAGRPTVRDVGPYALCDATSTVWCDSVRIPLTAREFALASLLFSNAGHVVSTASLAARVWGCPSDVCRRTLEQHVYRLRRKLAANMANAAAAPAVRIQAVYSIGYRLDLMVPQQQVMRQQAMRPQQPPAQQNDAAAAETQPGLRARPFSPSRWQ